MNYNRKKIKRKVENEKLVKVIQSTSIDSLGFDSACACASWAKVVIIVVGWV